MVVAIIAVLLSILLPALQRARDQAKQVLCLTNLRSLGQSARHYADEYGYVIQGEYYSRQQRYGMHFAVSLLPGLGYHNELGPLPRIWRGPLARGARMRLSSLLATYPFFQCPSFPNPDQTLDYVVNAYLFPLPATIADDPGQQTDDGPDPQNTGPGQSHEATATPITHIDSRPAGRYIYITEAHAQMPTSQQWWGRLHDVFLPWNLPFGNHPRIANDQRHPGGLNALYFDGHVRTLPLHSLDDGWPRDVSLRIQRFTRVDDAAP